MWREFTEDFIILLEILIIAATVIFVALCPSDVGAETMYVVVSENSHLNGRARPSVSADVECRFFNGDTVNVLEMADGWAKVDEGGEASYSWVAWDYLMSSPDGATQAKVSSDGRVRVRNNPKGDVVGYVRDGDVVSVAFLFDGWAKTNRGWIKDDYLVWE